MGAWFGSGGLNAGAGVGRLGVADQISDGLPKRGRDRPRRPPSHHENGCQAGWPWTGRRSGCVAHQRRPDGHSAASSIARMAVRMAAGSVGQASTTAARSGGNLALCAFSAPHSAPLWLPTPWFPDGFGAGSIPAASTFPRPCHRWPRGDKRRLNPCHRRGFRR